MIKISWCVRRESNPLFRCVAFRPVARYPLCHHQGQVSNLQWMERRMFDHELVRIWTRRAGSVFRDESAVLEQHEGDAAVVHLTADIHAGLFGDRDKAVILLQDAGV